MGDTYIRTREDMVKEFRGEKKRKAEKQGKGHFQLRLCISALLFLLFLATQKMEFSYQGINNETIIGEISENEDISVWQGRIVEVFKQLE